MNKILSAMWLIILALSFFNPVFAQYSETEVKAAYIERFTRFIEWPEEIALADTSQPFVLGVLGENPFDHILEDLYQQRKIKNREVEIRYCSSTKQITGCNMLYISASEKKNLLSVLEQIDGKPILTISDTEGFAEKGIHINLYRKDDKLHYEINESAIVGSGFSVWAQLLNSAIIVDPVKRD